MLQEMGLDRDACTEYLATSGALAASGAENDAFRVTSNYLNHHVQSSKWIQLVVLRQHGSLPDILERLQLGDGLYSTLKYRAKLS
jgi:hypothetical protein